MRATRFSAANRQTGILADFSSRSRPLDSDRIYQKNARKQERKVRKEKKNRLMVILSHN